MFPTLILILTLVFLLLASYFDLKSGEIPEKLSRSFIFSMGFLAFLFSLYFMDFSILGFSLLVGLGYFIFGYLTYYLGQWGGGDVKILAGIGLSLGLLGILNFSFPNSEFFPYYISYFLNMGLVAFPYAFLYGIILGFKNPKIFPEYFHQVSQKKAILVFLLSFLPSITALYFKFPFLSLVYLVLPLFVLISFYLKALEKVALVKKIPVAKLREGDVPKEDLIISGKKISARNIQGLEPEQIKEIQKLAAQGKFSKDIEIKFGIKFVPILMLAFLLLIWLGNPLEFLLP